MLIRLMWWFLIHKDIESICFVPETNMSITHQKNLKGKIIKNLGGEIIFT